MPQAKLGVIGGSGLYRMESLTNIQEIDVNTPFGKPSDVITIGEVSGISVAFLPRHGRGHTITPTELPVRANIYALRSLGVEHVIAINAVGSLKGELKPGDLVIPDQLIDRTKSRVNSFFDGGVVVHIPFAEPFCPVLSWNVYRAAEATGTTVHLGGTMVVMEGPAFSTRAESRLYRAWGADVIGMTALPEAKLAREAEMCYAMVACVTDYDSWRETDEPVTAELILEILSRNADTSKEIIRQAAGELPEVWECACARALETAIVTAPEHIPAAQKEKLGLLLGKYIKGDG
jgi:5'-methylthioadenosine phosphorylase